MVVVLCKSLWPDEIQDTGEWVASWLPPGPSVSFSFLAPRPACSTRPRRGTAKTGPKLGSRTVRSRAPSNDKYNVMDWGTGREQAGGKMVEVRVPGLIESRLYVCLLRHVPQGG